MSLTFRKQITQICTGAELILRENKQFPLPIKDPHNSEKEFQNCVQETIKSLNIIQQITSKILENLTTAHNGWMSLRTSMTESERAQDTPIYDTFLQETSYIKIMHDLKRYNRTLRTAQSNLEEALPKPTSQLLHLLQFYRLPELNLPRECLQTSNPSQNNSHNKPVNEMRKSPLKVEYNNFNDHPHRNPTNSQTSSYPIITKQFYVNPSVALKNETNDISGSHILDYNPTGFNSNNYNEISIGPPPGFPSLEEICITDKNNYEALKYSVCEELTRSPELINEGYEEEIHINSEESTPALISTSPPYIPPLSHPIICSHNIQNSISSETNYTSTSEFILEEKEVIDNIINCEEIVLTTQITNLSFEEEKSVRLNENIFNSINGTAKNPDPISTHTCCNNVTLPIETFTRDNNPSSKN
uniref:Uncharacterized protein n=1 Tax=Meloidogyne floridensis TaxID=298350 RepID=A0A915NKA0_9BILA